MIEFQEINSQLHKSIFIDMNLDYLTWLNENHKKHHHFDMEKVMEQSISSYVQTNFEYLIYLPPVGIFYLVKHNGDFAGMGGLKKINEQEVEIKRIYVRPQFRRKGIGKVMMEKLLAKAKEFNYSTVRLASTSFMKSAHKLYKASGFKYTEPFPESEVFQINLPLEIIEDSIFMQKKLD
jgi:GNAT superfamily N-acetyltransferase